MTAERNAALRQAAEQFVAALLDALPHESRSDAAPSERLLSITEAAEALGVGRTALYGRLTNGELESIKVGRRRLISSSALDRYIGSLRSDLDERP